MYDVRKVVRLFTPSSFACPHSEWICYIKFTLPPLPRVPTSYIEAPTSLFIHTFPPQGCTCSSSSSRLSSLSAASSSPSPSSAGACPPPSSSPTRSSGHCPPRRSIRFSKIVSPSLPSPIVLFPRRLRNREGTTQTRTTNAWLWSSGPRFNIIELQETRKEPIMDVKKGRVAIFLTTPNC